jgi:hypothetical protein
MGFKVPRHVVDYCFGPMHACSLHICNHAFYFIYLYYYLSSRISHDLVHEQRYLNKDQSFVMFTSSIRLFSVYVLKVPEMIFNLLTDSFS